MSKTINLLPDPVIETRKEVSTVYQGTLVSIIGLITFVFLNLVVLFFLLRASNAYDQVQEEISSVQAEINSLSTTNSNLRLMQTRMQRFVRLELSNVNADQVLKDIIEPGIEGVHMTRSELGNNELMISVSAPTLETAVEYLRAVRRQEYASSIQLNDIGYQGLEASVSFRATVTIATQ